MHKGSTLFTTRLTTELLCAFDKKTKVSTHDQVTAYVQHCRGVQ